MYDHITQAILANEQIKIGLKSGARIPITSLSDFDHHFQAMNAFAIKGGAYILTARETATKGKWIVYFYSEIN